MKHYCFNSNIYIYQKEAKWKNTEINTIRSVLKVTNVRKTGLTIRLSNDNDVKAFNYKWKGINKATNILSFANSDRGLNLDNKCVYLGDIIISYDTLLKEIRYKRMSLQDHLSHILIHGILHLKGYTHNDEEDTRLMQNEERRLLKNLNIQNPYKI
ncbi:MAG: rRNA maturation RNase YbeY [Pelagibacterales bacterium]|nr:rRNA maturation RNase YbeY [Pelagibacterales bacterium]MAI29901.1 rRNA maturation RNase YbeY [Rickettsiales bacterium]OUU63158.1 MAG: rRNA maturation RNase YbeY [Alphaproteobacteria bacterium TMED62]OUV99334.1 MAG: rRNA maturation RNase YbeY [Betaproteobacteria bacterium TMED156]|tara:strand:- start:9653 stop:10120 length:468 start_codon:yes stop_codon:yes gene_type:complete